MPHMPPPPVSSLGVGSFDAFRESPFPLPPPQIPGLHLQPVKDVFIQAKEAAFGSNARGAICLFKPVVSPDLRVAGNHVIAASLREVVYSTDRYSGTAVEDVTRPVSNLAPLAAVPRIRALCTSLQDRLAAVGRSARLLSHGLEVRNVNDTDA